MPAGEWLQLIESGELDAFETRCLEALEAGQLRLADLVAPLEALEQRGQTDRLAALGQMALENTDTRADPQAALKVARLALLADPDNDALRAQAVRLYQAVHGDRPGFERLLELSGLAGSRPARQAVNVLEMCLALAPGQTLLCRAENTVVEVLELDPAQGLVTLRQQQRPRTVTLVELAREYEPIAADDFRVLRALRPEGLTELLESDPVAAVTGLIQAHGGALNQDGLKRELVPRHISPDQWPKWWSRVRTMLKRSPHIVVEGRAPVLLRYSAQARTLEDAAWERFSGQKDPPVWLTVLEEYLRDKRQAREEPDPQLLRRCQAALRERRSKLVRRRPTEALACALLEERIAEELGQHSAGGTEVSARPAHELLAQSDRPVELLAGRQGSAEAALPEALWDRALSVLAAARPQDAVAQAVELVPLAPATVLDRVVELARGTGGDQLESVQAHIDAALADPLDYPDLICWLWKGPTDPGGLRLPEEDELFATIMQTFDALGRGQAESTPTRGRSHATQVDRVWRSRVRQALALDDYARVRRCIERISFERAVTLRAQLERSQAFGERARSRLLNLLRELHPTLWAAPRRAPEPWEDPDVIWSTAAGIQRKTEERDHLVNVTMRENAKRIGEAAAHGDLSENSEYRFALEERDLLRARLAQINGELAKAVTIDPTRVPTDHVGVGSRVRLRNLSDGSTRMLTFLGPFDADPERGIYNYRAPLAAQLMGLRVGQRKLLTLDNRECEYEVVEITNGLEPPPGNA